MRASSAFSSGCYGATASPTTCPICRASGGCSSELPGIQRWNPCAPGSTSTCRRRCAVLDPHEGGGVIKTAMILAAGRGERMRPVTDATPKPLIPVAGRTMLDRAMARLEEHGVTEVVINVHHLGEQIARHLEGRATIVREERLLETGGSVKNALPLLGDGPFFVLNGDSLWQDGRIPMLARMEAGWDPARMD